MHWLQAHVETLQQLAAALPAGAEQYRLRLGQLVHSVAAREGVAGCFAFYDGLLVETAGRADFEALAAMAQQFLALGNQSARSLALGRPQQLLLVGSEHKLALLVVEPFALGVLSPAAVRLGNALA